MNYRGQPIRFANVDLARVRRAADACSRRLAAGVPFWRVGYAVALEWQLREDERRYLCLLLETHGRSKILARCAEDVTAWARLEPARDGRGRFVGRRAAA